MNTGWIIGALFTILWATTFYLLTSKNRQRECEIKELQEKTANQELKIQHLHDKLWSEEKLTKVIVDAVSLSITQLENKWLKDGMLHKHDRRKNDPEA